MAESSGEKKHSATEQRRRKAREQGQVVRSQDLASAAFLLCALLAMKAMAGPAATRVTALITESLQSPMMAIDGTSDATHHLLRSAGGLAMAAVPFLLVMMAAGILVNVTQTGLILSTAKLMPSLSNIDPLSGAKRILSVQGVMRLGFGIFKLIIIVGIAYLSVRSHGDAIAGLAAMSVTQIAHTLFDAVIGVCLYIGVSLLILAVLEYGFQKWKYEQDLMMTDQEMRDEMKESEGDPQMAARRRQIQRQLAMTQTAKQVPQADVVVSNPTELAIAIRYDPKTMPAPIVLAKGAGVMAQRIRRLALEHGIPVIERKPLAQVLYKTVAIGDVVPPEQYQAVAEVLRYVYQLQGKQVPKAA